MASSGSTLTLAAMAIMAMAVVAIPAAAAMTTPTTTIIRSAIYSSPPPPPPPSNYDDTTTAQHQHQHHAHRRRLQSGAGAGAGVMDYDACMEEFTTQTKIRLYEYTDYIMQKVTLDLIEYPMERSDLGGRSLDVSLLQDTFLLSSTEYKDAEANAFFVDQYYLHYPLWVDTLEESVMVPYVDYACDTTYMINDSDVNVDSDVDTDLAELQSYCNNYRKQQEGGEYITIDDYPGVAAIVFDSLENNSNYNIRNNVASTLCDTIQTHYVEIVDDMVRAYTNAGFITMLEITNDSDNSDNEEQHHQDAIPEDEGHANVLHSTQEDIAIASNQEWTTPPSESDFQSQCQSLLLTNSGTNLTLKEYMKHLFALGLRLDFLLRNVDVPLSTRTNPDVLRWYLEDSDSVDGDIQTSIASMLEQGSSSLKSSALLNAFGVRACDVMFDRTTDEVSYCDSIDVGGGNNGNGNNDAPMSLFLPLLDNDAIDTQVEDLCDAAATHWIDVMQSLDDHFAPQLNTQSALYQYDRSFAVQVEQKKNNDNDNDDSAFILEVAESILQDVEWNVKTTLFTIAAANLSNRDRRLRSGGTPGGTTDSTSTSSAMTTRFLQGGEAAKLLSMQVNSLTKFGTLLSRHGLFVFVSSII
jgi:hypothetical protein